MQTPSCLPLNLGIQSSEELITLSWPQGLDGNGKVCLFGSHSEIGGEPQAQIELGLEERSEMGRVLQSLGLK